MSSILVETSHALKQAREKSSEALDRYKAVRETLANGRPNGSAPSSAGGTTLALRLLLERYADAKKAIQ